MKSKPQDNIPRSIQFYDERMRQTGWPKGNLCDPPTPADICLDVLIDELLGENWYVSMPENKQQTNTAATYEIIKIYVDQLQSDRRITKVMTLIASMLGVVIGVVLKSLF